VTEVSIVIPVYNEEDSIRDVVAEIVPVLESCCDSFEILVINDGSTDTTPGLVLSMSRNDERIKCISLNQRYGQTAAIDAGIRTAEGEFIITMDGDGQNDPSNIPEMLELKNRFDVICGWRINRRDTVIRRISSKIANKIRKTVLKDTVPDIGCTLKLFKADKLKRIVLYDGFHRFLPILLEMNGCNIANIPVNHRPRLVGTSKYGVRNRLFRATADMFVVLWMKKRKLDYTIKSRQ
jgi:glycosyltransferase involved in cell wall biosynthesis